MEREKEDSMVRVGEEVGRCPVKVSTDLRDL